MKINPIDYLKTAYRSSKPSRRIMPKGYTEGYFMEKSPLSKGYQAPTGLAKFCKNISNFFAKFLNN